MPKSKERWNAEYMLWGINDDGVCLTGRNRELQTSPEEALNYLTGNHSPSDNVIAIIVSDGDTIKIARKQPIPEPKTEWVFDDCDC